jgi:ATP-dependent Clp protease protease subunit
MIHQPSGGAQGQASDITIQAQEILRWKGVLNKILADNCSRSIEEIEKASDRDHYMDAKEAMAFGIADRVVDYKIKAPAPSA